MKTFATANRTWYHRTWYRLFALLMVVGCATAREPFDVTLEVEYGPAGRPALQRTVQVMPGATPEQVLAQASAVEKGSVCCDPRETAAIDGVAADPATNRWWTVSVNGSKKVSPYRTRVKPGDVVRWEYRQYEQ